jgi:hypothetical protein
MAKKKRTFRGVFSFGTKIKLASLKLFAFLQAFAL